MNNNHSTTEYYKLCNGPMKVSNMAHYERIIGPPLQESNVATWPEADVPLPNYIRYRWFNQMKFVPIVLARSFQSHRPTVEPIFSVTVNNYPLIADQVWHVRLPPNTSDTPPPPTQVLPWSDFISAFPPDPPICWVMGRRL